MTGINIFLVTSIGKISWFLAKNEVFQEQKQNINKTSSPGDGGGPCLHSSDLVLNLEEIAGASSSASVTKVRSQFSWLKKRCHKTLRFLPTFHIVLPESASSLPIFYVFHGLCFLEFHNAVPWSMPISSSSGVVSCSDFGVHVLLFRKQMFGFFICGSLLHRFLQAGCSAANLSVWSSHFLFRLISKAFSSWLN